MTARSKNSLVLAGDVGGTKTNLGLFAMEKAGPRTLAEETYPSRKARDLGTLAARFLEAHPAPVAAVCFGIPGPVFRGRSRTTNLPWVVSESALRARFGWNRVFLLNDLAAAAWGIEALRKGETIPISSARMAPSRTQALVAPGTGLGVSFLIRQGEAPIALASEGGHVDFAPSDEDELDLWRFARERFGRVSVERILSGPGMLTIYSWLRESGRFPEPPWLMKRREGGDPAAVIAESALEGSTPICMETLRRFASILGTVAGNVALTAMATGGVYLGGGIPPKILPVLREGGFLAAFVNKGRFRPLMEKVGVRVILNERIGLLGAARFAFERI